MSEATTTVQVPSSAPLLCRAAKRASDLGRRSWKADGAAGRALGSRIGLVGIIAVIGVSAAAGHVAIGYSLDRGNSVYSENLEGSRKSIGDMRAMAVAADVLAVALDGTPAGAMPRIEASDSLGRREVHVWQRTAMVTLPSGVRVMVTTPSHMEIEMDTTSMGCQRALAFSLGNELNARVAAGTSRFGIGSYRDYPLSPAQVNEACVSPRAGVDGNAMPVTMRLRVSRATANQ